ncbi:putative Lysosomal alpha-glucosidase [Monocercomonoides exilis]|uniref:putative Lysosomal alpha-glucosidase n=1 Tax=Monocercomonoides exilis TaxID=2049356 RepID=UPI00355A05BB|nr:putative Lysosomal alpha-glucosidase [Monocercomonoides exilis]
MILFLLVLVKASACGYAEYECRKVETDSVIVGEFVKRAGEGPFPPDAESLHFEVVAETRDRLHIKIVDNAEPAYEVVDVVEEAAAGSGSGVAFAESGFRVSVTEDCGIVVARRSSGETIFDTRPGSVRHGLAYGKGFVQLSTAVGAKPVIYGLGQRRTRFALPYPFNYTLTNQDRGTPGDGTNHYGTHPLHVERRAGGRMHGVLMLTASPLQVEIADGELTWRMMGGLIDLYIFLGGEEGRMEAVVEEYTELVGRPCLIPAWTLGLHQCYWGTRT